MQSLSERSLLKGLAAAVVGMMVATIGTDPISGVSRYTFGLPDLLAGVKPIGHVLITGGRGRSLVSSPR